MSKARREPEHNPHVRYVGHTPIYDALRSGWTGEYMGLSERLDAAEEERDLAWWAWEYEAKNHTETAVRLEADITHLRQFYGKLAERLYEAYVWSVQHGHADLERIVRPLTQPGAGDE